MILDFIFYVNLSWLLLGTVAALSFYWLWNKTRRPYMKYNIPPFPVQPWPIVGHFFMLESTNFRGIINKWRKKAGDIFGLDLVGTLHIVVNGYDNIKEVLVKNADNVTNTQHIFFEDVLNEYDKGIISGRDENWKEQRTVSLSILRNFGMGKNFLAEKIQEEVSDFINKISELKGRPHDFRDLINVSVSNVICAIVVGKRFDHNDPFFVRFINLNNNLVKYFNYLILADAFPILRSLPGDFLYINKWMDSIKELNEMFAKKYIKIFKETYNENEEPGNFIAAYLQEMNKRKSQGKKTQLDEENLAIVVRTLFSAGTETTSTTIYWCVLFMLHHPEIQEKVYREIEAQVGTGRAPSISDKTKLTYTNAVIMETQRMGSLLPVAFRREVSNQFEVGGYTFPKGSVVWPDLDSVLFDKKIWGDPENFRPERFLDKTGSLLNPEELIPFSIGRRVCLGQALGKMELFLFLSSMFQRFKFEPVGQLPSTEGLFGGTCMPYPYEVRFTARNT